ncbi:MAG: alanine racemase [Lachnospiraceae bacterium]|nr:alanine racemase [Lachnospiraceae bacterium]
MENRCCRGYIQVNLDDIIENLEHMKAHIDTGAGILAVIKTDGYGHGAVSIAAEIEKLDFLYGFAVATAEEAFELRDHGIKKPILVLGYSFPYAYERFVKEDIRPTVFREDMLMALAEAARKQGKKAFVHVKVDTGMGRIGIMPDESGLAFVEKLLSCEDIVAEGIFTHFACADMLDKSFTELQMRRFQGFIAGVKERFDYEFTYCHCSNSAAIMELEKANMDLVRAGIIMYGLMPSNEVDMQNISLKPALSLYSQVVFVKECEPGTTVSYGSCFVSDKRMRIATVPLGYGDGYPRSLSGKGYVLIRGQKAPILGRVCMDQFMVDVTHIAGACEGDKVTLIGRDGEEEITADYLGELSGRFNYELVCELNPRLPRIYLKK